MKFSYKFNNLLGTVYRQGDLIFTSNGDSVISPVGNRITVFDLKNNKSATLPIESRFNYTAADLSPNGCILLAVNEEGEAHMISLISQTIIHKYRFKRRVNAVRFSPDGKHFAVCKENKVFVFKAPGPFSGEYNAFIMQRVFHGSFDETVCIDWSSNSKIISVGSKDMSVKLYAMEEWKNFKTMTLSGHTDSVVRCFFDENNLDVISISRNGQAFFWECNLEISDLISEGAKRKNNNPSKKQKTFNDSEDEDTVDAEKTIERTEDEVTKVLNRLALQEEQKKMKGFPYKRLYKHYLADEARKEKHNAVLTAAAYHKNTKILVTGYSSGAFFIHDMPEANLIHSLSISDQSISTISINNTGDWIALGCGHLGQLLVWEWQSETYIMKQQGHTNNMSCVAYSIDGQLVATGGEDGKVKLWNIMSGFCFVTFSEHTAPVTSLSFSGNKKFVVSASLDGTVRAFDVLRYRNFRTFTTPRPVQLVSVSVDSSGEFVASGGQDVFEIFLWSVKTGRLLEVLSGHEGPVWSLAFSPSLASTAMASVSWDKTLRIWDAIEKGSAHETVELTADGLCVVFKPNGQEVAVATLDGQITVFDVKTAVQVANIEGRNDLGSGKSDADLVSAKKNLQAKSFTSLCYSADGEYILAGGQSKNVCIYNVKESLLVKKFEITQNRSFDAVDDFINRRKLTEFGNVDLVEEREMLEGGNVTIRLPGVRKGDMASRSFKPEVRVFSLQFSPTGQQWAAATTEGLLIYALNSGLIFDPWDLQLGITPAAVRSALEEEDFSNALMMSMKLNEAKLIQEVIENIPVKDIELIVANLSEKYIERLLLILSGALEGSKHFEFYLQWTQTVLSTHGLKVKTQQNMPALLSLQKALSRKYEQLSKICDHNKYTMQYIATLGEAYAKKKSQGDVEMNEDIDDGDDDDVIYNSDVEM